MLQFCFAVGGSGALHKINAVIRKEHYVEIWNQHLKTIAWKQNLGHSLFFEMDNYPMYTAKVDT